MCDKFYRGYNNCRGVHRDTQFISSLISLCLTFLTCYKASSVLRAVGNHSVPSRLQIDVRASLLSQSWICPTVLSKQLSHLTDFTLGLCAVGWDIHTEGAAGQGHNRPPVNHAGQTARLSHDLWNLAPQNERVLCHFGVMKQSVSIIGTNIRPLRRNYGYFIYWKSISQK